MNSPLCIPTPVRTTIEAPTGAKAARLTQKTKRREGSQPCKPFRGIRSDVQFSRLWADEHITASGSILNQRDERCSFLGRMTSKRRYFRLARYGKSGARERSQ